MIKRPLDERFGDKVRQEIKITTIRDSQWPVGKPIMLYHWEGKPYRSKHKDVTAIVVLGFWSIDITRHQLDDEMEYRHGMENEREIWETEGFDSQEAMDDWFRPLVKPGATIYKSLMRFRLATPNDLS